MSKMDQRMDRLEQEGAMMVELDRMSDRQLREKTYSLLEKVAVLREQVHTLNFEELASNLAECRGGLGLVMREFELRSLR